jgi:hypothetical protein
LLTAGQQVSLGHRLSLLEAEKRTLILEVLVDVEASASKTVFTEQINAALSGHRQLIEQLANSLHKPGDERVFVEADQLAREVENAGRNAP